MEETLCDTSCHVATEGDVHLIGYIFLQTVCQSYNIPLFWRFLLCAGDCKRNQWGCSRPKRDM